MIGQPTIELQMGHDVVQKPLAIPLLPLSAAAGRATAGCADGVAAGQSDDRHDEDADDQRILYPQV
jgi:hypothetical protein